MTCKNATIFPSMWKICTSHLENFQSFEIYGECDTRCSFVQHIIPKPMAYKLSEENFHFVFHSTN